MISIVQAELYRIKYAKSQYIYLGISLFFTLSLCVNYEYIYIEKPLREGIQIVNSWEKFFRYYFADYSMFYPLIFAISAYFLSDSKLNIYPLFVAKGIDKKKIFFSKILIAFLITIVHFALNIILVGVLMNSAISHSNEENIIKVLLCILLELICYIIFASFVVLFSVLFRKRNIAIASTLVFIAISYFYLTKIGDALDISGSLYEYWIIGFSTNMMNNNLFCDISKFPIIIMQFFTFIYFSYKLFVYYNGGET